MRFQWVVACALVSIVGGSPAFAAAEEEDVTFNDVVPILQKHCQSCHRPGQIAPMSLVTFEETRPWAESIRVNVTRGLMPPWHADPAYGHFANERRLSETELETLVAWVDGGAQRGNPKELPPPVSFPEGWSIGDPDAVYTMTEEYLVEAEGLDEYIYFAIPLDFDEERYIQAVELLPGNHEVVHHALVYIQPEGFGVPSRGQAERYNKLAGFELFRAEGEALRVRDDVPVRNDGCTLGNGGTALGGALSAGKRAVVSTYVPGYRGDVWPSGLAQRIPPSSELLLQMHYFKTGTEQTDRSSVGIVFAKEPPKKLVGIQWIMNYYFRIPPHAGNHAVTGCYTFDRDVHLLSLFPHMHVRGKDMKYTAYYPDGRSETLMWVPNYDFDWQTTYRFAEPVPIPRGTLIKVTAHFDNSKANARNPDPDAAVRWGDPSFDEMMIGGINYVEDDQNLLRETEELDRQEP